MPRPSDIGIDFNTEIDLTRSEGHTAQRVLAGFAFVFFPGNKAHNQAMRKEVLTTVLSAVGLLQRIDLPTGPEDKLKYRSNLLYDNHPSVHGPRREIH